ncbi:phosphoribosyltransferase [Rhodosalinus halophilus]|uniref:Phosphoribosyltransferase n=1 Tax=Rhodosalinus halophilus TaxID=2259333 RepID=A0A365UB62_9RHOB|nr:phosphoribosyltransferase family protein [Rhodosalinus halophilus]RBI86384.1 phosphoribosyltransferase [Rhodosalinus halophilus]
MFEDRKQAGEQLAEAVAAERPARPVVLALPRGGVPVAAVVAERLGAPLDLLLVRKLGMPGHEELAAGALVDGEPPQAVYNPEVLAMAGLDERDFAVQIEEKTREIAERRARWLAGRAPTDLAGRTAIVVDDGIATGATMRAALRGLRARTPEAVWLAVPVAPPDTLERLAHEADNVICLYRPRAFQAVGLHYRRFGQVSEAEVSDILKNFDQPERRSE